MVEPTLIRMTILDSGGRMVTACDLNVFPWHRPGTWEDWLQANAPEWLARCLTDSTGEHHASVRAADPGSEDGKLLLLGQIVISEAELQAAVEAREQEVRERMASKSAPLLALIEDFVDAAPCELDIHGHCQPHWWFKDERACPHARAKALLAQQETGEAP